MSPPAFACKLSPDSRSNRFQFPLHICCVREGGGGRSYESGRDMHEFMALVMNNMRRGLVDAEQIQCQWLIWLILCSFNVACKFSQIAYVLNYGIPYHAPPPFCLYPFFPLPASQPSGPCRFLLVRAFHSKSFDRKWQVSKIVPLTLPKLMDEAGQQRGGERERARGGPCRHA